MGKKSLPATPGQVFGGRVTEARKRRGLTQKQLAERLSMQRETVTTIENGTRRVTIDEWLAIAAALNAPPLHLIVPLEDDAPVGIGKQTLGARRLRAWIRGLVLLPSRDQREVMDFLAELPDSELESYWRTERKRGASPLIAALIEADKTFADRAGDFVWEVKEGERIRRKKKRQKGKEASDG